MNKKVEVHITNKCMYDCIFCSVNKHPYPEASSEQLKKDIDITKEFSRITFTGGEPLLRKDLLELIKYSRKFHKRVLIETHGVGLTREFVSKLIDAGLTELKLSFHSNDSKIYRNITRGENSFESSKNALEILRDFSDKLEISTNTVITKYNINTLTSTIQWLNQNFPFLTKIRVSYPRFYPIKNVEDYCKDKIVPLTYIKKELKKIMKLKIEKVFFENVPLCIANLKSPNHFSWELYLSFNGKITKGMDERYFPEKCNGCKEKHQCQGLHKHYNLYFNENFVEPFK